MDEVSERAEQLRDEEPLETCLHVPLWSPHLANAMVCECNTEHEMASPEG